MRLHPGGARGSVRLHPGVLFPAMDEIRRMSGMAGRSRARSLGSTPGPGRKHRRRQLRRRRPRRKQLRRSMPRRRQIRSITPRRKQPRRRKLRRRQPRRSTLGTDDPGCNAPVPGDLRVATGSPLSGPRGLHSSSPGMPGSSKPSANHWKTQGNVRYRQNFKDPHLPTMFVGF